jgi:hypothetical protein
MTQCIDLLWGLNTHYKPHGGATKRNFNKFCIKGELAKNENEEKKQLPTDSPLTSFAIHACYTPPAPRFLWPTRCNCYPVSSTPAASVPALRRGANLLRLSSRCCRPAIRRPAGQRRSAGRGGAEEGQRERDGAQVE